MTELITPLVYALTFILGGIVLKNRIAYNTKMQNELLKMQIEIALIELTLNELEK